MSSTCEALPAPDRTSAGVRLAVVVSGWPRLSETFALNELLALHHAGMLARIFATKPGEPGARHPATVELDPILTMLGPGTAADQAREVADRLKGSNVSAVHGYFAHLPAEVAAGAARRLGVPYGFSVHALDARKVPPAELAARAAGASVVVACNTDVAETLGAAGVRPQIVPHGVDLDAFPATPCPVTVPVELLAVGRLVEKKGFGTLLEALVRVDRDVRLRLVGDGPLRAELLTAIQRLGLDGRATVEPRRTHDALAACYARAALVVVPSVVDARGDRDGLPNVVLEAMASGRPVVASDVGAVSMGVRTGVTGRLVPPGDPVALATAITDLVDRPALRQALGEEGRRVVETEFDLACRTRAFCAALEGSHV